MTHFYNNRGILLGLYSVNRTASFVNERMCLDDFYQGYLNQKQMEGIINNSDIHFVFDPEDPAPYKRMRMEVFFLKIKIHQ